MPGRAGAVGEHVTEVAAALRAGDLGADHAVAAVVRGLDAVEAAGSTKLGQPEPEWNLASDRNSSAPQPAQR